MNNGSRLRGPSHASLVAFRLRATPCTPCFRFDRTNVVSRLRLSLGCWNYDRTRALMEGRVQPEGIELNYMSMPVEETDEKGTKRLTGGKDNHRGTPQGGPLTP